MEQCPLFLQHKCQQHRPFTCFNWHFQVQYSTVQYSTVHYSTVQYSTVHYLLQKILDCHLGLDRGRTSSIPRTRHHPAGH